MSDCGCDELCRDLSLLEGDKGDPGIPGDDGTFGANSDLYVFNSATVGNPTNTKLLFDNVNLSAATSISVSNVDLAGITVTNWLASLNTSNATLKGYIRVCKEFDNTSFVHYSVSAYTANAGYATFSINYLSGSAASPFTNLDNVVFSFVISGNNGAAGAAGVAIIYNDCTTVDSGNTGGANLSLKTFNIPANTFVGDGDVVTIEATNQCTDNQLPANADFELLNIVNNAVTQSVGGVIYSNSGQFREFRVTLNRTSATTLRVCYWFNDSNGPIFISAADMAGLDLAAGITSVTMYANTTVTSVSGTGYVKNLRLYADYKAI